MFTSENYINEALLGKIASAIKGAKQGFKQQERFESIRRKIVPPKPQSFLKRTQEQIIQRMEAKTNLLKQKAKVAEETAEKLKKRKNIGKTAAVAGAGTVLGTGLAAHSKNESEY